MNNYELTVVLDGKATPAKRKSVSSIVEKILETFEGKVIKVEDWGVKDLAYKVGKSETGIYLHFKVELTGEAAKKLPIKLRGEEEILRYLLIRKGENNGKKSK